MSARLPRVVVRNARAREPLPFWIATWFGCGLSPVAPGTVGALGATPVYLLLRPHGPVAIGLAAIVITAVGLWASARVAANTGTKDPQLVVIDEAAGVLVAWAAAPPTWTGFVAGFALFRLFDILKPFPCGWCERALPAGPGIMLDDICAGFWSVGVLLIARALGWLTG
jgi:phosphatidylglycerophosphatase A